MGKKLFREFHEKERGKMIAVYGVNNIGKTTQAELLVKFLESQGKQASYLKYPVYDLEPEGPFINKYLRDPNFRKEHELSAEALQKKFSDNRKRYEDRLTARLTDGEWIVAEDYIGTGVAWGLAWGADLDYLERINIDLLRPDICVFMHGKRFNTAIESDHQNETNSDRMKICKNFHQLLGERYHWKQVAANQSVEKVAADIIRIVKNIL